MKKLLISLLSSAVIVLAGCSDKPSLLRVDSTDATAYSADLTVNFYNKTHADKGPTTMGVGFRRQSMNGSFEHRVGAGDSVAISSDTTFNGPSLISGDAELQHSEIRFNSEFYPSGRSGSVILGAGMLFQEIQLDIQDATKQDNVAISTSIPLFMLAGYRYRPLDNLYLELSARMGLFSIVVENNSYSENNLAVCYSPLREATICGGYREVSIYDGSLFNSNLDMDLRGPAMELRLQF